MNWLYGKQWRSHYTQAQKSVFPPVQCVCNSVLRRVAEGESKDDVLAEYDAVYRNIAGGKTSKLVDELQARGVIHQQARRGRSMTVGEGASHDAEDGA
jgi:peptidase E